MEGMGADTRIGTKIKKARERKRWTQQQLADALGVSQKTIDNWEHDRSSPKSSLGALEEVLGVSLDGDPLPVTPMEELRALTRRIEQLTDALEKQGRGEREDNGDDQRMAQ